MQPKRKKLKNRAIMGLVSSVMIATMVVDVMLATKAKAGGGEDPGTCMTSQEINVDGFGITECLQPNTPCNVTETTSDFWGSGTVPHSGTCKNENDSANEWCGCYW